MTLPASPPIKASDINVELGRSGSAAFDINGSEERALAGIPSGAIKFSDFLGKSSFSVTYQGIFSTSMIGLTNITVSGATFGTASSSRRMFAAIHAIGGAGAARTLSSASIGGVGATIHANISDHFGAGTATWNLAIISALVPSGSSGNIVLNYPASWTSGTVYVAMTNAIGLVGNTANDTASNFPPSGGASASTTISVPANGVLIACGLQELATDITMSAPTPVTYDTTDYCGAILSGQSSNGSRSLALTSSGGSTPSCAIAGVTWVGQ